MILINDLNLDDVIIQCRFCFSQLIDWLIVRMSKKEKNTLQMWAPTFSGYQRLYEKISSLLFYLIKFRLLKLSIFDLMKIIIFSRLRQLSSWGLFSWRLLLTCDGLNRGSANLSNVDIYQRKPTPKKCNYCHFARLISNFTLNIHENRIPFEMRWKITEDIEVLRQNDKVADPLLMSGGERKLTDTQSAVETRQPYM